MPCGIFNQDMLDQQQINNLILTFLYFLPFPPPFLQLRDTKSIGHDTTLLHFLAARCEENHEALLRFPEELDHVESASKGKLARVVSATVQACAL